MPTILHDAADGIATITLNRPEKLNAFAGTMREELLEALMRAESDSSTRAVVITGAGRAFCSGGDVAAMAALQAEGNVQGLSALLAAGREIVTAIRRMPKIVIASINGVAAGAGCNLALACDFRIASEEAKLGETFVRIGLHPDWGGTWFLPRVVGTSRALELMATGRLVDAAEALTIGMVDRVVRSEALAGETRLLARTIADGPPQAIAMMKAAVYGAAATDLESQIAVENANQVAAFRSADGAEGIRAFLERRAPVFRGE